MEERYEIYEHYGFYRGQWGVRDNSYLKPKDVMEWRTPSGRRSTSRKHAWHGTREAAEHLAAQLNKKHPDVDMVTKGEMSLSQVIYYANLNRKKASSPKRKPIDAFKACSCGARYKGEGHCEQS